LRSPLGLKRRAALLRTQTEQGSVVHSHLRATFLVAVSLEAQGGVTSAVLKTTVPFSGNTYLARFILAHFSVSPKEVSHVAYWEHLWKAGSPKRNRAGREPSGVPGVGASARGAVPADVAHQRVRQ